MRGNQTTMSGIVASVSGQQDRAHSPIGGMRENQTTMSGIVAPASGQQGRALSPIGGMRENQTTMSGSPRSAVGRTPRDRTDCEVAMEARETVGFGRQARTVASLANQQSRGSIDSNHE